MDRRAESRPSIRVQKTPIGTDHLTVIKKVATFVAKYKPKSYPAATATSPGVAMLPYPSSPEFPAALKARRESSGLSRSALARAANIHGVMPRRYEEPDCREFAKPRADTWIALNKALGYDIPDETLAALAQEEPTNSTDMDTPSTVPGVIKALTLAEAKAGLAITFGVNIDQIEITIRG